MHSRTIVTSIMTSAFLVIAACAAQSGGKLPEVSLVQMSGVPNVRLESASGMPMDYQLRVENRWDRPITLISVELESVGESGAYVLRQVRQPFDHVIEANTTDTVEIRAWVHPLQVDNRGAAGNPVNLRGSARFRDADGKVTQRNFVSRGQ